MELFKLFATIAIKNKEANDALDETSDKAEGTKGKLSNAFSKIGSAAVKVGKVIATGLAAGAGAVTAITKQAVEAYADYEQLVGGVETLFKDSADIVMNYANNAYKTAGLSANDYMETVTSFSASLLQGLDGDTEKAAEIADLAITDMADNANKMGTSMESIQNAYQGFAKQNYTMLDNLKLGYGGTQAEMIRLINDSGILNEKIDSLDDVSFDQMILAIHEVQDNLDITGTTAKEAATTIQGSISSFKASWENLLVGMADDSQDFDALLENVIDSGITVIENILPKITTVFNQLPKLISGILPQIPPLLKELLPQLLTAAEDLLHGLVNALPDIIDILLEILPDLLDAIMEIGLELVNALPEIVDSLIAFLTDQSTITALIQAAITLFMAIVAAIPEIANQLLEAAPDIISGLIIGLIESIPQLLEGLGEVLKNFLDLFLTFFGIHSPSTLMKEKAGFILQGIIEGIKELPQKAVEIFIKLRDKAVERINDLKTKASAKFLEIKEKITATIENAKEKISEIFNNLKSNITDKIENIKSSVISKFDAIKEKMTSPIEKARDTIKSIVDKIKGFFSGLKLSFPDIKLPHFALSPSGWKVGDLLKGSIPKLSIDWYAKAMDDGMILNQPTIFGINSNGQPMGGGDAGSETVVGTQSLMNMINNAVGQSNNSLYDVLDKILAVLKNINNSMYDRIVAALQTMGIEFDERELARLVRKYA